MGIPYRGPDAANADDLITLGQGDTRWATITTTTNLQNQIDTSDTSSFGGPTRTQPPLCEVRLATAYSNAAKTDAYAGSNWAANTDTDTMFTLAGQAGTGGWTAYSRIRIPITGRYLITYQVTSAGTTAHNAAIKVMARTDNLQPTVAANSIATDFCVAAASTEGGTPHLTLSELLTAGTYIYWTTWRSVTGNINTTNFGGIKTKIVVQYTGPN